MLVVLVYPAYLHCYLYSRRDMLKKRSFKKKYGSAYTTLKEKDQKYLWYPLIFFYRRLVIPLAIIKFPKNITVHFLTLWLSGVASIGVIGTQRPFKSKARGVITILEECVIILIMYQMFCFTDWIKDLYLQRNLGISLNCCVVLHLFIFFLISFFVVTR